MVTAGAAGVVPVCHCRTCEADLCRFMRLAAAADRAAASPDSSMAGFAKIPAMA